MWYRLGISWYQPSQKSPHRRQNCTALPILQNDTKIAACWASRHKKNHGTQPEWHIVQKQRQRSAQSLRPSILSDLSSSRLWGAKRRVIFQILQQTSLEPISGDHGVIWVVPRQSGLLANFGVLRYKSVPDACIVCRPANLHVSCLAH